MLPKLLVIEDVLQELNLLHAEVLDVELDCGLSCGGGLLLLAV